MIYEIINPSDACTVEADDDMVAAAAILLLGDGMYGARREGNEDVLPIFVLGGAKALDAWLEGQGVKSISDFMRGKKQEIAACLDSLVYGKENTRKAFLYDTKDMLEEMREAALAKHNDKERSSLNNIGENAKKLAAWLRENEIPRAAR
jgi:hypothetical protein